MVFQYPAHSELVGIKEGRVWNTVLVFPVIQFDAHEKMTGVAPEVAQVEFQLRVEVQIGFLRRSTARQGGAGRGSTSSG